MRIFWVTDLVTQLLEVREDCKLVRMLKSERFPGGIGSSFYTH